MQKHSILKTAQKLFYSFSSAVKPLRIGDNVTIVKHITRSDIETFMDISGDTNPIHVHSESAKSVVHGAFLNALVSGIIGTMLPGPGTLVVSQTLNFPNKCFEGDLVKITVTLTENRKIMKVKYECVVEKTNKTVLFGDARLVSNK